MKRGLVAIVLNDMAEELVKGCEGDPSTWRPDGPQDRALTKAWALIQGVRRTLSGPQLADKCEEHEWHRAGEIETAITRGPARIGWNLHPFWNDPFYQGMAFPPKCWVPMSDATRNGPVRGWSMRTVLDFLGEQAEPYPAGSVGTDEMAAIDARNREKAAGWWRSA